MQGSTVEADVDCIVIGAGVVGLACARALVAQGRQVWVLEREARAGEGVSSRNSGVIHAGFYYPPGSLKARLCVRGLDLLYAYCAARGVPHRRIGKWVVATRTSELSALRALAERGLANGVHGLRLLDAAEVRSGEPQLRAVAALDSPDTGIVDVAELVMALIGDIERADADRGDNRVLCETEVVSVARAGRLLRVATSSGDSVSANAVVNAAGLAATGMALRIEGMDQALVPRLYYGAGHYYTVRGRTPFQRLVYPLPEPGGLGVHLGFDMAGRARFGPDLSYRDQIDYRFDDTRRSRFAAAVRAWWPALVDEDLQPDFVGIRPKLSGPGEHNPDFVIQDGSVHGIEALVNLFGIESPGLTASLAIGEEVASRLRR
ncbi:MAG TPA: NAD(P)/FAD-dependent oxidoreductase [Xanthomonadaceae bacterium]|nr:NAD(P)/FAD-dependent oxidoreductase [Xanthomonadaceae bacterium]